MDWYIFSTVYKSTGVQRICMQSDLNMHPFVHDFVRLALKIHI